MARYDNRTGFWGLFNPTNKVTPVDATVAEGPDELELELDIKLPDATILTQVKKWETDWEAYAAEMKRKTDESKNYYLGKQYSPIEMKADKRPQVDNLIFESLETFLPIATRANPEPLVVADNTEIGNKLADRVKKALVFQADHQRLRMLLKRGTRQWSINFLGVFKVGWDYQTDDIKTEVVPTNRLILDKDATVLDGGIYTGYYIGERKTQMARKLVEMFPKHSAFISSTAKGKMGTNITYTEWWTCEYVFYTLGEAVLGKFQNPHWNYDGEETIVNAAGAEEVRQIKGTNHFETLQMPYIFLSVFNLGEHPHDDTSLIYQNLANQDVINKRARQIDRNADSMNNGIVVSGDAFTSEQAAEMGNVLARGGVARVPTGPVTDAFMRASAPSLPADVFNQLADTRNELRNIFGTGGSTPQGIASEDTVRGKIITNQLDSSRIGGGVTEYIEQAADTIYNWWVQLFYVYYDNPHYAAVMGQQEGEEVEGLRNTDFGIKLTVSVKEGSLIPKDPLTQRNEAMDLWNASAIDPITLFTKLDFPNPYQSAKQLYLWQNAPQMLFQGDPEVQQVMAQQQAQQAQEQLAKGGQPTSASQTQSANILDQVPIG